MFMYVINCFNETRPTDCPFTPWVASLLDYSVPILAAPIVSLTPNIIRQIKSRRMRWVGHMARMGDETVQGFGGKARRKDHLEDQGVDGRMGSE
jgi:hypothetical protein